MNMKPRICAYVQEAYAKANYKNECMETRQFVGLRVIIDALERAGYPVDWAGAATVHTYDIVLVSLTSDCDWWSFIAERQKWQKGDYKVIIGGAGVLHITPFLPFGDYFSFGRGEKTVVDLVKAIDGKGHTSDDSIADTTTFDDTRIYRMAQADGPYPHTIALSNRANGFNEGPIGCNHKCLFCGYTWHRKFHSPNKYYAMADSLFGNIEDKERAMLDIQRDPDSVDFSRLRTTAIDGMSQRLRFMVNKRISREAMVNFIERMVSSDAKPHQIKFYNIVGYPSETEEDWVEFLSTLRQADPSQRRNDKQWSILLHSTPFRAMPATPLACAPMSLKNYRGEISRKLGKGLKGHLIYQGRNLWSVESGCIESLCTVMLSAIAHRGGRSDSENIAKLCNNKKFWNASCAVKEKTLSKYFDLDYLFGEFSPDTLPSRYLRTYCAVEKMWQNKIWKNEKTIKLEV